MLIFEWKDGCFFIVAISDPNRNHNNNNHNNELQSQLQSQQVKSPSQLCNSISSVDIHHPSS